MAKLDARAAEAVAKGAVEEFLDAELSRDRDRLEGWVNGADLPVRTFLPVAGAAARSGRVALLRPSRQLVLGLYDYLQGAAKREEQGESGAAGDRPSGKAFSIAAYLAEQQAPADVALDALRYVIGASGGEEFLDGVHALLFREAVGEASGHPGLDDLVAEQLARAPGDIADPLDPGRLVRLYGARYVSIHLRAIRSAGPEEARILRRHLETVTGLSGAKKGAEFDRSVEAWLREEGPFLEVDPAQLPPRPFGKGWLRPDRFAKLVGRTGPRPPADDPLREAFEALADDRKAALADESAARRAQDFAAWLAWLDAALAALAKKP